MMQAFAYKHLVPAQDLKVALVDMVRPRGPAGGVQGGNVPAPVTRLDWSRPMTLTLAGEQPVKIPTDGSAEVRITGPSLGGISRQIEVELSDPPPGLTVKSVSRIDRGLSVVLHCDAGKTRPGRKGNLIANAFLVWTVTDKEGKMPHEPLADGHLAGHPFRSCQTVGTCRWCAWGEGSGPTTAVAGAAP